VPPTKRTEDFMRDSLLPSPGDGYLFTQGILVVHSELVQGEEIPLTFGLIQARLPRDSVICICTFATSAEPKSF